MQSESAFNCKLPVSSTSVVVSGVRRLRQQPAAQLEPLQSGLCSAASSRRNFIGVVKGFATKPWGLTCGGGVRGDQRGGAGGVNAFGLKGLID